MAWVSLRWYDELSVEGNELKTSTEVKNHNFLTLRVGDGDRAMLLTPGF
jgi:hypothetical protein